MKDKNKKDEGDDAVTAGGGSIIDPNSVNSNNSDVPVDSGSFCAHLRCCVTRLVLRVKAKKKTYPNLSHQY